MGSSKQNDTIRFIDLFCGLGGTRIGLEQACEELGLECECVLSSDKKPSSQTAYKHNFGEDIEGDICKIDEKTMPDFDVLLGGFPCFVAGSLVLTKEGLKPIEEIIPGEMVLTHKGRYRKVISVMSKTHASTIVLKGQGTDSIECTPNHHFFSSVKENKYINKNGTKRANRLLSKEREWVDAKDMPGRFWINVAPPQGDEYIPPFDFTGCNETNIETNEDFFYMIGRWLGDGCLFSGSEKSRARRTIITCGYSEEQELEESLRKTGIKFHKAKTKATFNFVCEWKALHNWIFNHFGKGAKGKHLPSWVYSLSIEKRRSLLQGYIDADGCCRNNSFQITSINKKLLIGIKNLAATLGYHSSMRFCKTPDRKIIEGREVNDNDFYMLNIGDNFRSAVKDEHGFWGLCRKQIPGSNDVTVYNLEVEEDHSYTVDGIAVSNCQAFSRAGKRRGFSDTRGTMFFEIERILREKKPKYVLLENVPELMTHDKGNTFLVIKKNLEALGYSVSAKVLDASEFGVAQKRRRTFICAILDEDSVDMDSIETSKSEKTMKDILEDDVDTGQDEYIEALLAGRDASSLAGYIITDKRRGDKTLHSWDFGMKGNVTADEKHILETLLSEHRKREYAEELGVKWRDGMPLNEDQLSRSTGFSKKKLRPMLDRLTDLGYLMRKYPYCDDSLEERTDLPQGWKLITARVHFPIHRILSPDEASITLTATDAQHIGVVDGDTVRKLTIREGLRLFGFPEDYDLSCVSESKAFDLIGNSICVPVVKAVAKNLLRQENDESNADDTHEESEKENN